MHKTIFIFINIILAIANGAQISGRISTLNNRTPSQTTITALDVITGRNYTTTTTSDEYSIIVPDSVLVEVQAAGTDMNKVAEWVVPGYFPLRVGSFQLDKGNTVVDITLEPCYTLILTQYNSEGGYEPYSSFSIFNYVSDDTGSPVRGVKDEIFSNDQETLGILIPLDTNVRIMTDINIFGYDNNIVIPVDNNGKGYISSTNTYGEVVNLNYQVARTLLLRVNNKNDDTLNYPNIAAQSISNMNDIMSTLTDMNDHVGIYNKTRSIISDCIYVENVLEVSRAQRTQDGYRKTGVSMKTTDQSGQPTKGISISFVPKQYVFNFGIYGGNYNYNVTDAYKLLLDAGINTVTVDFWWSSTESNSGQLNNYDIITQRIEYLLSLGLKLRATGLFQPSANIIPSYARGLNYNQFQTALRDHITSIVTKYCTRFDTIEVSTDLNILGRSIGFTDDQILSLQKMTIDIIINNAPGVKTSISTSNTYIPVDNENSWNIPIKGSFSFARDYVQSGVNVDDIGYSIYNGINAEPQYTLGLLSDILDKYQSINKPVRISKFTVPSSLSSDVRDQYISQFYKIAYSKKNVNEITWSNMISSTNGLFNTDMTPTSLYYTLKSIISGIRYNPIVTVDDKGYTQTSLVGGRYNVNVYKDGNMIGQSDLIMNEGRSLKLSVVYDTISNKASVINDNGFSGIQPGALPPTPSPQEISSKNNINNKINNIPPYGIFLIVFGTILFIAAISSMIIFILLKKNVKHGNKNVDIETSVPVGNTLPREVTDNIKDEPSVKLDESNDSMDISPERWTEGPLATTTIELEEDEDEQKDDDEEEGEDESTDSDSMEDVELDENDVRTTSSSENDSDEEHL